MSDIWKPQDIVTIIEAMAQSRVASIRVNGLKITMCEGTGPRTGQAAVTPTIKMIQPVEVVNYDAKPTGQVAEPPLEAHQIEKLERLKKTAQSYSEWGSLRPPTPGEQSDD